MSKDEKFEELKSTLKEWKKKNLIESLSTICTELIDNGVEFGSGGVYLKDGFLKAEDLRYGVPSTRELFTLNFKYHDKEFTNQIEELENKLNRSQNTINQIDEILEKLFGVRHDIGKPDEFEKILSEIAKGNVSDFLPAEPIKVADMLINAEGEYEHNPVVKKICGNDKGTYRIFEASELRQIAEHLLVYCNNQKENVNE